MITNKEIIKNQLRRINKKSNLDLQLQTCNDGKCFLESSENVLFETMCCYRSEEQMIEYLEGFEDAFDYFNGKSAIR